MQRKLDEKGRLAIPKEFRSQLCIAEGEMLNVNIGDKKIEISKPENTKSPLEELKKWLRVCLDEEEQKTISKTTSYEMGIITTLRSVIAKIEELEKDKK